LITFDGNADEDEEASNQKILYFPILANYCFCTTCKNENCIFSLKCYITGNVLPEFDQGFFNLVNSQCTLMMPYDYVNLVINGVQFRMLVSHSSWKRKLKKEV